MIKEKEIEAARLMMHHAISNYCKLQELEDAEPVISAIQLKIEQQASKEKQIDDIRNNLLGTFAPFSVTEFLDKCDSWSWNLNIAEIAKELIGELEPDKPYWEYYGDLFVMYFSNNLNQESDNKQAWETIGYILETFVTCS
jgi:hypothetical protein